MEKFRDKSTDQQISSESAGGGGGQHLNTKNIASRSRTNKIIRNTELQKTKA
jgi:hypothetical protein